MAKKQIEKTVVSIVKEEELTTNGDNSLTIKSTEVQNLSVTEVKDSAATDNVLKTRHFTS